MKHIFRKYTLITLICICSIQLLWTYSGDSVATTLAQGVIQSEAAPDAGPDLLVEKIETDPAELLAGITADIKPTIKNIGDASAPGLRIYLYVDPVTKPISGTATSAEFVFGLPLAAGDSFNGWTSTDQPIERKDPYISQMARLEKKTSTIRPITSTMMMFVKIQRRLRWMVCHKLIT